jgi:hypothetical protein
MNNIVGGLEYQHAHADQGFGIHPFQMWLYPRGKRGKNDYGFLHTMSETSLLLMHGDFVHAGGISWFPRCHMKFFPKVVAGMIKGHNEATLLASSKRKPVGAVVLVATLHVPVCISKNETCA